MTVFRVSHPIFVCTLHTIQELGSNFFDKGDVLYNNQYDVVQTHVTSYVLFLHYYITTYVWSAE